MNMKKMFVAAGCIALFALALASCGPTDSIRWEVTGVSVNGSTVTVAYSVTNDTIKSYDNMTLWFRLRGLTLDGAPPEWELPTNNTLAFDLGPDSTVTDTIDFVFGYEGTYAAEWADIVGIDWGHPDEYIGLP